MFKKLHFQSGEAATLVALISMAFILLTTITSTLISKKPQTTSTKAAAKPYTCTASANLTCMQICLNSSYVPNSQTVSGALRTCKCTQGCSFPNISIPPGGGGSGGSGGDVCYSSNNKGGTCGASYTRCSDCEKICGIGQCESCKLGSTIKWQCIRSNPTSGANVPTCSQPKTYANLENCKQENSNSSCTQCILNGAIRYEVGGSGPKQCSIGETLCGNNCCNANQECKNNKTCVDKCKYIGKCDDNLTSVYQSLSNNKYYLLGDCNGDNYDNKSEACYQGGSGPTTSSTPAKTSTSSTPAETSKPAPEASTSPPIPLPTERRCSIGDCYYKANIFVKTCPDGKETYGESCYMNFGGSTGWQWGNCCVEKMQPTPLPTQSTYCQSYLCSQICSSWGYRFSREPNRKVYKGTEYEIVYTENTCSSYDYSQCSCTNKLNEAQTGVVTQEFITTVQPTTEDCYMFEIAGGKSVCATLKNNQ